MSLKVDNIVKTYGSCRAVDGLSFEMKEPGVFALLGTNGAGKTTSIRIILGMLSADSGSVTWHGEEVRDPLRSPSATSRRSADFTPSTR